MDEALKLTKTVLHEETGLDEDKVQRVINDDLGGADVSDLFVQKTLSEAYGISNNRDSGGGFDIDQGFGVRYVVDDKTYFSPSPFLEETAIAQEAANVKKIRSQGGNIIIPASSIVLPQRKIPLYGHDNPILGASPADKVRLMREINDYLRSKDPRVEDVSAGLSGEISYVRIFRPGQPVVADVRPLVRLNVGVTVLENGKRESGGASMGGRYDYSGLFNEAVWKTLADEALRVAFVNHKAQDIAPGTMTVVVGPGWPAVLLHEAVGHGLEADFNRTGSSKFSGMIGQRVAAKGVTVVDQGDRGYALRGSLNVDDEGNETQSTTLIEDGVLVGYLQDALNARLMKMPVTGNGRRESWEHLPMPRMTNTFMLAGDKDPQEIITSVQDGIYAVNFSGGQVVITNGDFVFEMSEAYRIRNGRVIFDEPVRGATLIGNGPETMSKISMIGNDLKLDPGVGTCGKSGQSVPVGVGQPTLRIDGISVGGRLTPG